MKDVAILGYGPVGALLANLLGQAGLSVAVYERDTAIYSLPRAVHFDGEVMRIFQSVGLADRIAAMARPSSQGMHFVNTEGRTLMVRRGIDGPGPHGWPNNWYFHQPALEQILRDGVERFSNVEVHLGREIADVDAAQCPLHRRLRRRSLVGAPGHRQPAARSRPASAMARGRPAVQPRLAASAGIARLHCPALRSGAADDGRPCRRCAAALGDHADAGR